MNGRKGRIKGVIEDFHFRPLHQEIGALVLFPETSGAYNYAMARIADINSNSISQLETTWKKLSPETPFTYTFLDDEYRQLYKDESRLGRIFGIFSTIAIVIASLGLMGLVSFTAVQRLVIVDKPIIEKAPMQVMPV